MAQSINPPPRDEEDDDATDPPQFIPPPPWNNAAFAELQRRADQRARRASREDLERREWARQARALDAEREDAALRQRDPVAWRRRQAERVSALYGGVTRPPTVQWVETRPPEVIPMTEVRGDQALHHVHLFARDPLRFAPPLRAASQDWGPVGDHLLYARRQWIGKVWQPSGLTSYDVKTNVLRLYGYYHVYRFDVWVAEGDPLPEALDDDAAAEQARQIAEDEADAEMLRRWRAADAPERYPASMPEEGEDEEEEDEGDGEEEET